MVKYNSFIDFGAALKKLMDEQSFNYRGNIVYRKGSGYMMSGKYYANLEEINTELDRQFHLWDATIQNQNL